ncbi:MAG: hypothetical protein HY242_07245 [Afipia sp.]|nr:hypothetical protein [Afipia sp.]
MQRGDSFARLGALVVAAQFAAGFMPLQNEALRPFQPVQAQGAPASPQPPYCENSTSSPEPEKPLTAEEQKAADARLQFDRVLVDAAVLLNEFEESKRDRSKTNFSMSAFRNFEIQLNAIADADPANDQARDWAKKMQMAQFEILQPSVAVADVASRQLYADRMSDNLKDQGVVVMAIGRGARVVRFMSRQMTRDMGQHLLDSAKIADQSRSLQFERVIFSNGRRSWTFDVGSGRYR